MKKGFAHRENLHILISKYEEGVALQVFGMETITPW